MKDRVEEKGKWPVVYVRRELAII